MNLQFEGHTLEVPDSLKIGDVFAGPDGREYELGMDGAVYPVVPATPEIRRFESDFLNDLGVPDRGMSPVSGKSQSSTWAGPRKASGKLCPNPGDSSQPGCR
jgi:hypothetical protein